jgi:hypothetical protein
MYIQHYIRVISLVQKGRDGSEEDQRHSSRGNNPKESSSRGSSPKERRPVSIDVKWGEIVTLIRFMFNMER